MKKKICEFLNRNTIFIDFVYGLIVINVIAIVLESYHSLNQHYKIIFKFIEVFSVAVFSLEYLLRLYTIDHLEKYEGSKLQRQIKFMFSFYGIIDLLAILPFYLPFIIPFDLRFIRILRLFRLLRIFKFGRYSKSMRVITSVIKEVKEELLITMFIIFVLLIFSSSIMYYIENPAQPAKFTNMGESLWWATATLTTVGYGDIYPVTPLGKMFSAVIALLGIGFVALPSGIIAAEFFRRSAISRTKGVCKCPNCGTEFGNSED